jgi:hypothetical protein
MDNQQLKKFMEDHRQHTLEEVGDQEIETVTVVAHAHDRATTRALLQHIGGSDNPPAASPAASVPNPALAPPKSRQIKPGSQRAKARAAKAQETRKRNLEDKAKDAAKDAAKPTATAAEAPAGVRDPLGIPARRETAIATPAGLTPPPGTSGTAA